MLDIVLQMMLLKKPPHSIHHSLVLLPAGSGKTTLLNILSGRTPLTEGSVSLAGEKSIPEKYNGARMDKERRWTLGCFA